MIALYRTLICLSLLLLSQVVCALPAAVRNYAAVDSKAWQSIGQGEMRWLGFRLYRAQLWANAGRFDPNQTFALQLTYARDIPATRLVSVSLDEMQRLGTADTSQLARWETALKRVFPDVKEGDSIVGMYLPGRGAAFFHQDRLSGEVADVEFAQRFFDIWLDPRTQAPALRRQLLALPEK